MEKVQKSHIVGNFFPSTIRFRICVMMPTILSSKKSLGFKVIKFQTRNFNHHTTCWTFSKKKSFLHNSISHTWLTYTANMLYFIIGKHFDCWFFDHTLVSQISLKLFNQYVSSHRQVAYICINIRLGTSSKLISLLLSIFKNQKGRYNAKLSTSVSWI